MGTPYAPHTLEVAGEERLVIELQELDCVTFVENVLALARFVRSVPEAMLDDPTRHQAYYSGILQNIRYRMTASSTSILHGSTTSVYRIGDLEPTPMSFRLSNTLELTSRWRKVSTNGGIRWHSRWITHPDAYGQLGEDRAFIRARTPGDRDPTLWQI